VLFNISYRFAVQKVRLTSSGNRYIKLTNIILFRCLSCKWNRKIYF